MQKTLKIRAWALSGVAVATLLSVPAYAQDDASGTKLDEIVVTAQKREQNLQDVPVSISAISGEALAQRGLSDVEDLENAVPGLSLSINAGTTLPFLRGIGNPATSIGNEASVAIYIDGVYYSRLPSGAFSLNNVSRVEVLKGPQGTLFGRNASGGVIHLVTRDPSSDPVVEGNIGYGNFNTVEGDFYGSTGLGTNLSMDIAVAGRNQGDGFGKYVLTGNKANFRNQFNARSKLLFTPGENTRITLAGFYASSTNVFASNAFPGTRSGFRSLPNTEPQPLIGFYDQPNDYEGVFKQSTWGGSLTVEQKAGFAQLKSVTAYMDTFADGGSDSDFSPRPDLVGLLRGNIKQFTQELQVASLAGSKVQWVAGLFYYDTTSDYNDTSRLNIGPSTGGLGLQFFGKQRVKSYAAYGQATVEVLPKLRLTGGLRHTWDRINAAGATFGVAQAAASTRSEKFSFRAGADYRFSDDVLGYASYSRGYKSAVFNLLTYNPVPNLPEEVDTYEVGLKTEFLDRRVRLNLAAYINKVKNPQVTITDSGIIKFLNAGAAEAKGIEADLQFAVSRGFTVRASAAYLDSTYTDFGRIVNGQCIGCAAAGVLNPIAPFGALRANVVATGNRTPYASKFTGNIGFDYETDLGNGKLLITGDYAYNDGYFTEPDNFLHQKAYSLVSASVKYSFNEHWAVRIWGRNLLDTQYIERANTNTNASGYTFSPADPLTYGAAISVKF